MRIRLWALGALVYFSLCFGMSYGSSAGYEALSHGLAELANRRTSASEIQRYNEFRDREFILDMFKKEDLGLTVAQVEDIFRERIVNVVHEFDIERRYPRRRIERVEEVRYYPMSIRVYVHQGKPVGFIMSHYRFIRKPSSLKWALVNNYKPGRIGAIEILAVSKPMRKKGIARKLLESTFQTMKQRGAEWVYIGTEKTNTAARNLYRSVGFREISQDRDRVYLMRRLT